MASPKDNRDYLGEFLPGLSNMANMPANKSQPMTHSPYKSPYQQFQQEYPEIDQYLQDVASGQMAYTGLQDLASNLNRSYEDPSALEEYLGFGGMTAFHGSPHKFGKFLMDKIGTGEGAQAYGHGLYFAESPGVARSYRDALSSKELNPIGEKEYEKFIDKWAESKVSAWDDAERINHKIKLKEAELNKLPEIKDDLSGDELLDMFLGKKQWKSDPISDKRIKLKEDIEKLERKKRGLFEKNERLKYGDSKQEVKNDYLRSYGENQWYEFAKTAKDDWFDRGHLYEVDIPDEQINKMLDWDAPLSEQPESVRKAIQQSDVYKGMKAKYRETGEWFNNPDTKTGDSFYKAMPQGSDKEASEYLNQLGIKGIKYFDQASRGAGEGTRNFVVFDEDIVKILDRK